MSWQMALVFVTQAFRAGLINHLGVFLNGHLLRIYDGFFSMVSWIGQFDFGSVVKQFKTLVRVFQVDETNHANEARGQRSSSIVDWIE